MRTLTWWNFNRCRLQDRKAKRKSASTRRQDQTKVARGHLSSSRHPHCSKEWLSARVEWYRVRWVQNQRKSRCSSSVRTESSSGMIQNITHSTVPNTIRRWRRNSTGWRMEQVHSWAFHAWSWRSTWTKPTTADKSDRAISTTRHDSRVSGTWSQTRNTDYDYSVTTKIKKVQRPTLKWW